MLPSGFGVPRIRAGRLSLPQRLLSRLRQVFVLCGGLGGKKDNFPSMYTKGHTVGKGEGQMSGAVCDVAPGDKEGHWRREGALSLPLPSCA